MALTASSGAVLQGRCNDRGHGDGADGTRDSVCPYYSQDSCRLDTLQCSVSQYGMGAQYENTPRAHLLASTCGLDDRSPGADHVVGEDDVSALEVGVTRVHLKSRFSFSLLSDASLGKCGMFRAKLSPDGSRPLFGFFVWSDDDRFLGFEIVEGIPAEQRHCRKVSGWDLEDFGDVA